MSVLRKDNDKSSVIDYLTLFLKSKIQPGCISETLSGLYPENFADWQWNHRNTENNGQNVQTKETSGKLHPR